VLTFFGIITLQIMSSRSKTLVVDKRDLKRLMSEKKGFTSSRNENKIESRFAKYPFGCGVCIVFRPV